MNTLRSVMWAIFIFGGVFSIVVLESRALDNASAKSDTFAKDSEAFHKQMEESNESTHRRIQKNFRDWIYLDEYVSANLDVEERTEDEFSACDTDYIDEEVLAIIDESPNAMCLDTPPDALETFIETFSECSAQ